MVFTFTNKQELFNCIKDLNQKYYKPVDEFLKIYEEYSRKNGIPLLGYFRDAHGCLVKATLVEDVASRKKEIDKHLEKYVKILLTILIHEFTALITVRKDDLINAPLCPDDKSRILDELTPRWKKLRKRTSVKYTYNNTIEELDEAIGFLKETYEFIEGIHKKYIK